MFHGTGTALISSSVTRSFQRVSLERQLMWSTGYPWKHSWIGGVNTAAVAQQPLEQSGKGQLASRQGYFFKSRMAPPGPRFLALQMLQYCAGALMLGMGRHSLWNMCRQWKTTTLKGFAASGGRMGERHDSQIFSSSTRTPFIWVRCIFFSNDNESATRIFLQPSRSRICKL